MSTDTGGTPGSEHPWVTDSWEPQGDVRPWLRMPSILKDEATLERFRRERWSRRGGFDVDIVLPRYEELHEGRAGAGEGLMEHSERTGERGPRQGPHQRGDHRPPAQVRGRPCSSCWAVAWTLVGLIRSGRCPGCPWENCASTWLIFLCSGPISR